MLHGEIMYILWCQKFAQEISLCKTHEAYKDFLKESEVHCGDCTKDPCPCSRCHLQQLEIDAQNAINHLDFVFKDKTEPTWKKLQILMNKK